MKTHELKILPEYFKAQEDGIKNFEIRKNDRNYKVGDKLVLLEYNPESKRETGKSKVVKITYITDYEQKEGYVVLGTKPYSETSKLERGLNMEKLNMEELNMEELPNVYDWNTPHDILVAFDTTAYKNKYGIKFVLSEGKQMLLFKLNGCRYILPNEKDEVQYAGNGNWNIRI